MNQSFVRKYFKIILHFNSTIPNWLGNLFVEVNEVEFLPNENAISLDDGVILSLVNGMFSIGTPLGNGIRVRKAANGSLLTIVTAFLPSYENSSFGLVGKWNGNIEDDFTLPNGTVLPIDMSESEIFHKFGEECELNATGSQNLFS